MTSDVGRRPAAAVPNTGVPLIQRIYGLGSVFGKTLRDSRRATIVVAAVLGLILIGVARRSSPSSRRPSRARSSAT